MFHKKVVHAPVRPFSSIREMLSLAVTEDGNKIAYKFKQKDVDEVVTGRQPMEDKLKKWYAAQGYKMYDFEVRYNVFNGRFYISASLRRPPDKPKNRKERLNE